MSPTTEDTSSEDRAFAGNEKGKTFETDKIVETPDEKRAAKEAAGEKQNGGGGNGGTVPEDKPLNSSSNGQVNNTLNCGSTPTENSRSSGAGGGDGEDHRDEKKDLPRDKLGKAGDDSEANEESPQELKNARQVERQIQGTTAPERPTEANFVTQMQKSTTPTADVAMDNAENDGNALRDGTDCSDDRLEENHGVSVDNDDAKNMFKEHQVAKPDAEHNTNRMIPPGASTAFAQNQAQLQGLTPHSGQGSGNQGNNGESTCPDTTTKQQVNRPVDVTTGQQMNSMRENCLASQTRQDHAHSLRGSNGETTRPDTTIKQQASKTIDGATGQQLDSERGNSLASQRRQDREHPLRGKSAVKRKRKSDSNTPGIKRQNDKYQREMEENLQDTGGSFSREPARASHSTEIDQSRGVRRNQESSLASRATLARKARKGNRNSSPSKSTNADHYPLPGDDHEQSAGTSVNAQNPQARPDEQCPLENRQRTAREATTSSDSYTDIQRRAPPRVTVAVPQATYAGREICIRCDRQVRLNHQCPANENHIIGNRRYANTKAFI